MEMNNFFLYYVCCFLLLSLSVRNLSDRREKNMPDRQMELNPVRLLLLVDVESE